VVDLGTGTETAGYRKSFAVQFSHCWTSALAIMVHS
jgi:hypothetical protein